MADKHVGERIRILRRARGLTLQQVAAETGLTASFLSQMERNLSGVTLSSLASVAKALEVPLREIVTQPVQTTPDTHQGERQDYSVENVSLHYERLSTSFPGSCLHALKIRIPEGYSSGFESHAGEELLFVLAGCIDTPWITGPIDSGPAIRCTSTPAARIRSPMAARPAPRSSGPVRSRSSMMASFPVRRNRGTPV